MIKRFKDIYAEIIQQLIEAGSDVQVKVVIRAQAPEGLQTHQQRALLENARGVGLKAQLE